MPCLTTGNSVRTYGALRSVCFLCGSMVLLLLQPAWALADTYQEQLVAQAAQHHLATTRDWDVLLHYRPRASGRESLIDDPRFFLAPAGKSDPAAELDATIRGLFNDAIPMFRAVERMTVPAAELICVISACDRHLPIPRFFGAKYSGKCCKADCTGLLTDMPSPHKDASCIRLDKA